MKSDRKKRILAAILCMVMVLSGNISALAEGEVYADPDAVTQMETPEAVSETQPESAPQEPAAEEPPVSTEPAAPEAPAENNEPAAPETPAGNNEPAAPETPAGNNEPAAPETPEAPEEEDPVFSEETELTKELRDASGKLVQKVTAKLPKGAFEAETSQIEMEVTYVDSSMENYIKGMMEKKLPTDNTLGDYFLYNIQFKVNGEAKESLEPITITFEKSNLEIKDTKKANVFFFDPANPEVSGDKDELVEITQRSELLESLQAAGQSTATMEEDYDLSSIEIKEENRSGKIVLEGRKSTIYGCYVEKQPEQQPEQPEEKPADIPVLNYEDDKVTVSVTAEEAGIIPEGAELKVVPITSEDAETKEQYQEVEKKIQEKVAEEEKEVAGFLAYDITFVDKDGNEMKPNGKVKVSMNYKEAELPQEVVEKKATDAEVTVLHLEEDENGEVKQVVDMGAEQKANVDTLTTTEGAKVQNVEVETESFSVFTITWKYSDDRNDKFTIIVKYVDEKGNDITVKNPPQQNMSIGNDQTVDLSKYWREADGYEKKEIRVDELNGDVATHLRSYSEKYSFPFTGTWTNYYVDYKVISENQYSKWLSDDGHENGTIYFIYRKDSSSGGGTGGGNTEGTLGAPQHKKYIEENVQGQDYTLNLDVTGKRGEKVGVDVLLVLDKSGSMKNYGLMTPMKECVTKTILPKILPDKNSVNRVSAISFSSKDFSGDINTGWQNYDSCEEVSSEVNSDGFMANGGTNWELAMKKAEDSLKNASDSQNKKVVIFLSDGAPGYYLDESGNEYGVPNPTPNSGAASTARTQAVNYVKETTYLKKASIYSVYLTQDTSTNMVAFANELRAADIDANSANGTNMDAAIQEILKKITTPVYKKVSIEDVLSEYVVLADEPNYKVQTVINGNPADLGENLYTITTQPIRLANDKQSTKIIVDLLNEGELKENVTYRLSFHVKPSEFAISEYARLNGEYPHRGDEETDTPGKDPSQYTSSGKPGFYSNDSATLHYQENEGIQKHEPYKKPVIQVQEKKTELTIKKTNSQGVALQGAEFELQKEGTDTKVTVISSSNGEVILQNLMTGTYILKETKAPPGYEKLLEEWKVIVQEDGENVTATLYKADGTTSVENNKIVNYTETEIAEKNLKSSKTAKVVDENERIFQIDLSAATSGQEAGQAAKGASIVLALDASSSMEEGNKSLSDIQTAAKNFVDSAYESSKSSEIAVVWYNGSEDSPEYQTNVQPFKQLDNANSVLEIKNFITNKSASGGTPMGDAMMESYNLIKQAKNDNRYVVFFTDGKPGYRSGDDAFNCMVANNAYNYAKKIKDKADGNAVIYTVGYGLSDSDTFKWKPGDSGDSSAEDKHEHRKWDWSEGWISTLTTTSGKAFLSDYIATTGKDFTTSTADGLSQIFEDIEGEIGALFTIQPEKIVDVIDARFELTDASKAALEEAGVYIISNTDGTTTIEWTGEKATIGNENAGTDGSVKGPWSASFQIKAKDNFIGGNMIPTNGAASGIYLEEGKTRYFEQPSVNVKLLSLSMENKESWYYKGDTIEPAGFMNELDETLKIHQLNDQVTDTGNPILSKLTEEQKTELVENGTLVVNANGDVKTLKYVYPNTSDAVGYFCYTYAIVKDSKGNPLGNMGSHAAEKVGKDVEQYKLTVEFIPYSVEKRDATLDDAIKTPATNGGAKLNPQTGKLTAEGIYSVNVVAGEIQITKKLEETSEENQTFSFVVTKDGEEFKTIDIIIPAGTKQATYFGAELKNLSRGNYKIVESKATGYGVKEIILTNKVDEMGSPTAYETDCKSTLDTSKSVEFVLGKDKNDSNVIQNGKYKENGAFGGVLFTNEKTISDWGIVKRSATNHNDFLSGAEFQLFNNQETYYGKSNENGLVEWYDNADFSGEKVEKLGKGSYTLKETKAPNLYAVSDEEWTVEITHDGDLKTIQNKEGKKLQGELDADGKTYKYYFDNVMLYELPESGGTGIFVYTIGGTLLLMAAALLIYKMKREEVLKG